jgi:hypothetical protein
MDDEDKLEKKWVFTKRNVDPAPTAGLFVLCAFPAALLLPFVVLIKFSAERIKVKKPGFEPVIYPVSPKSLYDFKIVFVKSFHTIT